MKKRFIEIISILLILSGCKQIDKLTQFEIEYDRNFTIPANTSIDLPFDIPLPDIETNSEESFAVNDTRKDRIEEVRLTSLNFKIESPSDADFSFINSVNVFISAEGLPEILVAWQDSIPENTDSLELETSDADLKEYIKKDTFDLRFNTIIDELLTSDHVINMHSVFFVDAKILGQ